MTILLFVTAVLFLQPSKTVGFVLSSNTRNEGKYNRIRPLHLSEDVPFVGDDFETVSTETSTSIFDSLKQRQSELEMGIGKRYVCRTKKGFLNVHKEPGEPFNPYNIVNQLSEGDIVTSVGPPRGQWIRHDSGGWSIATYNGFKWLEELKE